MQTTFIAAIEVVPIQGRAGLPNVDPIDPPGIGGVETHRAVRIGDVTGRTGSRCLLHRPGPDSRVTSANTGRVVNGHRIATGGVARVGAVKPVTAQVTSSPKTKARSRVVSFLTSVPFTVQAMVLSSLSPSSSREGVAAQQHIRCHGRDWVYGHAGHSAPCCRW